MANKTYLLSYDDVLDKDIKEWLESLPRNRKAEMVRAIRQYMHTSGSIIISPMKEEKVEPKKVERKRPKLGRGGNFEKE
ncbi:hypothetical protein ACRS6Y_20650 [Bacillus cytotoxicus]|uniref:Uncharacterized protein n=2 Tax=Bacillus cytotoxicus TaxID=580165 RepID=A0AAX2CML8_9BACI|nr:MULTISPECIES: hypothetical protein [Bacillus cereus group]ABS23934.1 hypothetical protein Bcer98_3740 [Bacillus cytotoxicus NVH 391-98]AWC34560.1 hypothetical protein CG482_020710 [Bacillus cytotoxicus]AWC38557.1 hypothetical protein CG481_020550 [Bacillus cytotoxicus]AWC46535.1 hypothetical protein CG479_019895 [Bacillus cytotoxicus]AWC62775.1 hypothetical protein CG474_020275 [Bacillus cytotoxicus]